MGTFICYYGDKQSQHSLLAHWCTVTFLSLYGNSGVSGMSDLLQGERAALQHRDARTEMHRLFQVTIHRFHKDKHL